MRTGLQRRVSVNGDLTAFTYNGQTYTILEESRNRDLIPGSSIHRQVQYIAKDEDGSRFEVYVYYYNRVEGGSFAVVDTIREAY